MIHLVNTGHSPQYLQELITLTSDITFRSRLRSANNRRYETPVTRLKISERNFSLLVRQHGILYPHLYRTSVIIALLNETSKLNFLTVYTRHKTVLFVMRYWSRGVSGALEKRELEV